MGGAAVPIEVTVPAGIDLIHLHHYQTPEDPHLEVRKRIRDDKLCATDASHRRPRLDLGLDADSCAALRADNSDTKSQSLSPRKPTPIRRWQSPRSVHSVADPCRACKPPYSWR